MVNFPMRAVANAFLAFGWGIYLAALINAAVQHAHVSLTLEVIAWVAWIISIVLNVLHIVRVAREYKRIMKRLEKGMEDKLK